MTAVEFVNALRHFGVDVLLLAAGVTLVTSLLKKTVLKTLSAKLYVFLPFLIGVAVYAVYRMLATWSVLPVTEELKLTLEGGFSCGSAATLYYAVYEQFVRGTKKVSPVLPLLGFVAEDKRKKAADEIFAARGEEDVGSRVIEILLFYAPDVDKETLADAAELIVRFLESLG